MDYLLGKLLGVLLVVAVALLLMDLLMTVMLHFRTEGVLAERMAQAERYGWGPESTARAREDVLRHGPTWSLQAGVLAVFLKAAVIAAVALLVSTFSTSTLFTIIVSFLVYFIGSLVGGVEEIWSRGVEGNPVVVAVGKIAGLLFPNLKLFDGVVDGAIGGQAVPALVVVKLAGTTLLYAGVYTVLSWFVFADKEF